MAYLTINGTDFPVSVRGPSKVIEEFGDRYRSHSGDMRSSIRHSLAKRVWRNLPVIPLLTASVDALITILQAGPPLSCSGDMVGGVPMSGHASDIETDSTRAVDPATGSMVEYQSLSFTLHEQ